MKFSKFHGYGNDYIICAAADLMAAASPAELVRQICDRHYGAGADGIATVEPWRNDAVADFAVRIFNPDGGEAAMSGNGTRAAASYLYEQGLWANDELRLHTRAGVKLYQLLGRDAQGGYCFAAEIGRPAFASADIPLNLDEPQARVLDYPLELPNGETVHVTSLQMCNPNTCVFVDDFEVVDWRRLGRLIETHPRFPERTNVIFVHAPDREHVEARVWERGVGETLSSGTGACAAAVAACVNDLADRRVTVEMPGGHLEVEWRDDGEVVLTGTASFIYNGQWGRHQKEGG